jgi:DNA gyrase subunit A
MIVGDDGIKSAYENGKGKITLRAKSKIEKEGRHKNLIITEIPYQVNKSTLIQKIADLVNDEKITEISEVRDESDREGIRVVIILKRSANAGVVLNQLYKYTQMQTTFGIINLALVKGRPKVMDLKELIYHFVEHRVDIIIRRTIYDLDQAEARAHILEGLKIALDNLDEVIKTIKASKDKEVAKVSLIKKFKLSEKQAVAILEMRLQNLANLERQKIEDELKEKQKLIKELESILASKTKMRNIIKQEVVDLDKKYGDKRRTKVISRGIKDFNIEEIKWAPRKD